MNLLRTITVFLKLASLAYCWDPKFLMDFIVPVIKLAGLQEVLWFPSLNLSAVNSEKVEYMINTVHESVEQSQYVMSNRTDWRFIKSIAKRLHAGIVFTTSFNDPIVYIHDRIMIGCHFSINILVMMEAVDNFDVVEQFVRYMRKRNFYNSLLYIQSSNGSNSYWGYIEFPHFVIENRTDIWAKLAAKMKKIRAAILDTEGYKFQTPLRLDVPYVFQQKDSNGNERFRGTSYRMIELFIDFVNATLVEYKMPPDSEGGNVINMADALNLVREDKIDFLAHTYALFSTDDEIDKSYPIMVVKWCLMVPVWNTVSTYFYPVQPFDNLVWYAFLLTFVALTLTDLALISWKYKRTRKSNGDERAGGVEEWQNNRRKDFVESIFNDFCYVFNISTGRTPIAPTTLIRLFLILTVFFYGFFLAANYTSLLGSILTVTLFRENINTMDDLIKANVSVMIIDYEMDFLLAGDYDLSPEFLKLLLPVDVATFNKHQLSLNTSFGYFITDDKWHFIRLQQAYLKQAIFKFTDICFGSHHLAYALRPDSSIWRNFEFYIFRMHSSGILQYYESTSFDYAVHAGLMKRLTATDEYTSAGMQHLFVVFMLLTLVCVLSFFIFLGEHFVHWHEKRVVHQPTENAI